MFTWICPQCGREVPPAYDECPDCAKKAQGTSPDQPQSATPNPPPAAPRPFSPSEYTPPGYTPPLEPVPVYQPPVQNTPAYPPPPPAPPPQPAVAPPPQEYSPRPGPAASFLGLAGGPTSAGPPSAYAPPPPEPPQRGLPTWFLTIVFTIVFLGIAAGVIWFISSRGAGMPAPSATVESPAAKPGAKASPYQKYIEIAGVRFIEDAKKKPMVTFIIVNHSNADMAELGGNVTVWGRTRTSEEEAAGTFTFKTSLGPNESKELKEPLTTKLKFYELPDWQNVSTDIQITVPAASGGSAGLH